jgi:hypothetical protein
MSYFFTITGDKFVIYVPVCRFGVLTPFSSLYPTRLRLMMYFATSGC